MVKGNWDTEGNQRQFSLLIVVFGDGPVFSILCFSHIKSNFRRFRKNSLNLGKKSVVYISKTYPCTYFVLDIILNSDSRERQSTNDK